MLRISRRLRGSQPPGRPRDACPTNASRLWVPPRSSLPNQSLLCLRIRSSLSTDSVGICCCPPPRAAAGLQRAAAGSPPSPRHRYSQSPAPSSLFSLRFRPQNPARRPHPRFAAATRTLDLPLDSLPPSPPPLPCRSSPQFAQASPLPAFAHTVAPPKAAE
jgi:hypothetical protein